jgi:hypothetical protein
VACGDAGLADLLLNAILFVPLGIVLHRAGARWWVALASGLGISLAIETAQAVVLVGRDATLGDLAANTLGTAMGMALVRRWRRPVTGRPPLAVLTLGAWIGALLLSGWLLQFDLGAAATQRLGPGEFPGRPTYPGTLIRAAVDDSFSVLLEWQEGTSVPVPVVRLDDARGRVLAGMTVSGQVAVATVRVRGTAWRLRTPRWSMSLPVRLGDTVAIGVAGDNGRVRLMATAPVGTFKETIRVGPQHGWLLLNPFAPGRPGARWLAYTVLWLAAWGAVLGLAVARARGPVWWLLGGAVALVVVTATHGAVAGGVEVAALLAGGWLGISAARLRQRQAVA